MKTIILGPPGTGKTTTLLDLVEEFLRAGTDIKKIGYFSFTKTSFKVFIKLPVFILSISQLFLLQKE